MIWYCSMKPKLTLLERLVSLYLCFNFCWCKSLLVGIFSVLVIFFCEAEWIVGYKRKNISQNSTCLKHTCKVLTSLPSLLYLQLPLFEDGLKMTSAFWTLLLHDPWDIQIYQKSLIPTMFAVDIVNRWVYDTFD